MARLLRAIGIRSSLKTLLTTSPLRSKSPNAIPETTEEAVLLSGPPLERGISFRVTRPVVAVLNARLSKP